MCVYINVCILHVTICALLGNPGWVFFLLFHINARCNSTQEVSILKLCQGHPNIVHLHEVYSDEVVTHCVPLWVCAIGGCAIGGVYHYGRVWVCTIMGVYVCVPLCVCVPLWVCTIMGVCHYGCGVCYVPSIIIVR